MGQEQILAGLDSAVGGIPTFFIKIFSSYVSPIIIVICLAVIVFTAFKAGTGGAEVKQQLHAHLGSIAILVVVILLCITFSVWSTIMLSGGVPS